MLRNIVFDIGGVLVDYHTVDYYTARGYDPGTAQKLAEATMFSSWWKQLDLGLMPESWIYEKMKKDAPDYAEDIDRCLARQSGIVTKRAESRDWIEHLRRQGYRMLVLSNFSANALLNCPDAMDFLSQSLGGSGKPGEYGVIGEGIISTIDHMIKSYPEIYALLLTRFDLRPEETIFVDDTQANLDAAADYGIQPILFRSRSQVNEEIEKLSRKQQQGQR